MPWYTPNPAPGLPITSAWGNAVENAAWPTFTSKTALDAGWADAPDGAHAYVLNERRTYTRRGAAWLLPLENVYGNQGVLTLPQRLALAVPPIPGTQIGEAGPWTLRGKRTYMVLARNRTQLVTDPAANNGSKYCGLVVNFRGTLNDAANDIAGGNAAYTNAQRAMTDTYSLGFPAAVRQGSSTGMILTGGVEDQLLTVYAQVCAENPSSYQFNFSAVVIQISDVGPAA